MVLFMKGKLLSLFVTLLILFSTNNMTVFAYTPPGLEIVPVDMILYTNETTTILSSPDIKAVLFSADLIEDNIPVHVIGITNYPEGYFVVDLGTEDKYYVFGTGLVTNITASDTTVNADANKKYTAKIGTGDESYILICYCRRIFFDNKFPASYRKDYTNDALYIYLRDQLEAQIIDGVAVPTVVWNGKWNEAWNILENLRLDMLIDHPQYRHYGSEVDKDSPLDGKIGVSYVDDGTTDVTLKIRLSTSDYDGIKIYDI